MSRAERRSDLLIIIEIKSGPKLMLNSKKIVPLQQGRRDKAFQSDENVDRFVCLQPRDKKC